MVSRYSDVAYKIGVSDHSELTVFETNGGHIIHVDNALLQKLGDATKVVVSICKVDPKTEKVNA